MAKIVTIFSDAVFGWEHQLKKSIDYLDWKYHNPPSDLTDLHFSPEEMARVNEASEYARQVQHQALPASNVRIGKRIV